MPLGRETGPPYHAWVFNYEGRDSGHYHLTTDIDIANVLMNRHELQFEGKFEDYNEWRDLWTFQEPTELNTFKNEKVLVYPEASRVDPKTVPMPKEMATWWVNPNNGKLKKERVNRLPREEGYEETEEEVRTNGNFEGHTIQLGCE